MTRKLQAVWGLTTDVGGQAVVTLATFAVTPLMLRMTSKTEFGAWQTVLSLLTYLGLLDLGLGMALVRTLAALPADGEEAAFNCTISSAYYSFWAVAVLFLAAGWWLSGIAPMWFGVTGNNLQAVVRTYRWATVGGALALPAGTYGAILAGRQQMAQANTARTIGTMIGIGSCIWLLMAGFGVVSFALSNGIGILSGALLCWWLTKRSCPGLKIRPALVNWDSLKQIWKFGGLFQVSRIANTVAVSADSLVIASRLNAAMVTPYNLTSKLPIMCSITLASKLPLALFPGLSSMFAEGKRERVERVLCVVLGLSTRLACVSAFLVGFCNQRFVMLWVGHDAYGGSLLNWVFVYWAAQDTLLRGLGSFVYASGLLRGWAAICIVEAVVNLVSSFILAGPLGLVGVAMGTSIARSITLIWLFVWFQRQLGVSMAQLIRPVTLSAALSVPGCLLGWVTGHVVPESVGWIWLVLVGSATLAGNLLFFEGGAFLRGKETNWMHRLMAASTSSLRY